MLSLPLWARAGAIGAVAALLAHSSAFAHAVCGARIFPATLGIDDPGVTDELALPTLAYLPSNSDGATEVDAGFSWAKTIFPNVALVISDGATWQKFSGQSWAKGYGWDSLDTELQWGNFCLPEHELMATVGFDVDWGRTGSLSQYAPYSTYTPVLDVGKGFGDLPTSLNWLRPAALTFELSQSLPGQSITNGSQNAANLNWGFTLQYSLPYFNSNVGEVDNDFFRHLIPITEFTFSKPIYNFAPGTNQITGTIQPGAIYLTGAYQVAVEAIVPANGASGRGVGVIAELDLFLDDVLPDSLGKPIFVGSR